jgi:hypothetical protein
MVAFQNCKPSDSPSLGTDSSSTGNNSQNNTTTTTLAANDPGLPTDPPADPPIQNDPNFNVTIVTPGKIETVFNKGNQTTYLYDLPVSFSGDVGECILLESVTGFPQKTTKSIGKKTGFQISSSWGKATDYKITCYGSIKNPSSYRETVGRLTVSLFSFRTGVLYMGNTSLATSNLPYTEANSFPVGTSALANQSLFTSKVGGTSLRHISHNGATKFKIFDALNNYNSVPFGSGNSYYSVVDSYFLIGEDLYYYFVNHSIPQKVLGVNVNQVRVLYNPVPNVISKSTFMTDGDSIFYHYNGSIYFLDASLSTVQFQSFEVDSSIDICEVQVVRDTNMFWIGHNTHLSSNGLNFNRIGNSYYFTDGNTYLHYSIYDCTGIQYYHFAGADPTTIYFYPDGIRVKDKNSCWQKGGVSVFSKVAYSICN